MGTNLSRNIRAKSKQPNTTTNPFPLHGISLKFLHSWTTTHAKPGETTKQLVDRVILPLTLTHKESFVAYLQRLHHTTTPRPWSDIATHFISHAWTYEFMKVIQCLTDLVADADTTYVWIDSLVINQHNAISNMYTQEWWSTTFHGAIAQIGKVFFVTLPWADPTALRRAWCLWEVYGAIKTQAEMTIVLPSSERDAFLFTLLTDFDAIQTLLAKVDAAHAQAWNARDLEMIQLAIKDSVGMEGINRAILSRLRAWLIDTAMHADVMLEQKQPLFLLQDNATLQEKFDVLVEATGGGGGGDNVWNRRRAFVINACAKLLVLQGDWERALFQQQRALELDLKEYGPDSPNVARDYNNLGYVLGHLSRFQEALVNLEKARLLRIQHAHNNSNDPAVLRTMYNIGEIYDEMSSFDLALQYFEPVMMGFRNQSSTTFAKAVGGVAHALRARGDFTRATELYREAIQVLENDEEHKNHPLTASLRGELVALLTDCGRFQYAEELLNLALATTRKDLGDDHPDFAMLLNNQARLLVELGRYEEALVSQTSAQNIDERVFGSSSAEVARDENNTGFILLRLSRLAQSKQHLQNALRIRLNLFGSHHVKTAHTMANLAEVEMHQGHWQQAEQLLNDARAVMFATNATHPHVALIDCVLGKLAYEQGDFEGAKQRFNNALDEKYVNNVNIIEHANILIELSRVLVDNAEYVEALRVLDTAAQQLDELLVSSPLHPLLAELRNGRSRLLHEQGNLTEAIVNQREAMVINAHGGLRTQTLEYARDCNNLGFLLVESGSIEEALPLLELAVKIRSTVLGEDNPTTLRTRFNLAEGHFAIGHATDAIAELSTVVHTMRLMTNNEKHVVRAVHRLVISMCLCEPLPMTIQAQGEFASIVTLPFTNEAHPVVMTHRTLKEYFNSDEKAGALQMAIELHALEEMVASSAQPNSGDLIPLMVMLMDKQCKAEMKNEAQVTGSKVLMLAELCGMRSYNEHVKRIMSTL